MGQIEIVTLFNDLWSLTVEESDLSCAPWYIPAGDALYVCVPDGRPGVALDLVWKFASKVANHTEGVLAAARREHKGEFLTRWWSDGIDALATRIAVSHGSLIKYNDITGEDNYAGTPLNEAARLLHLARPDSVIFSPVAYEIARDTIPSPERGVAFHELGAKFVKDGQYKGYQLVWKLPGDTSPIEPPAPPSRQGKSGEDELPHPWFTTNHSIPDIPLVPVSEDERTEILSICFQHYRKRISLPKAVQRLGHATGARLYRVTGLDSADEPILLKFSKSFRSAGAMTNLMRLHQCVSAVFLPEYAQGLVALTNQNGEQWQECILGGQDFVVLAYPFLQGVATGKVSHFAGKTLHELESVAMKFAAINGVLRDMAPELVPEGETMFRLDHDRWSEVLAELGKSSKGVESRGRYLGRAELGLIKKTMAEVKSLGVFEGTLCLNDLHPHNVFMAKEECVLIFDYEAARTNWPEVASFSFASHRFCREYVGPRVRSSFGTANVKALANEASKVFLDAYAGPNREQFVEQVLQEGLVWAKAVNFAKLMDNFAYELCPGVTDSLRRSEREHWQEIVKFISYLKELDAFGVP